MNSQEKWFSEYAVSHQNPTNQKIHYLCVPLIFFSIVGILMSIPSQGLGGFIGVSNDILVQWATVALIPALIFYLRLSIKTFALMLVFSLVSIYGNFMLSQVLPLLLSSVVIFAIAWIGQFYGHHIEGKKPSFFKDVQFLLIGPAWVFEKLTR